MKVKKLLVSDEPGASHVPEPPLKNPPSVTSSSPPNSPLPPVHSPEWRSELVVANWILAGLDKHTLHRPPPVVQVGRPHAVNLSLASDGVAVLLACHAQIHVSAHVFKAHGLIALPVVAVTLNGPYVQVVTLAILSKSADLLWMGGGGRMVSAQPHNTSCSSQQSGD